ncbi:MAG: hypothetical protein JXQ99_28405 [Hyphomicrobiaceae bacterium]
MLNQQSETEPRRDPNKIVDFDAAGILCGITAVLEGEFLPPADLIRVHFRGREKPVYEALIDGPPEKRAAFLSRLYVVYAAWCASECGAAVTYDEFADSLMSLARASQNGSH